MGNQGFIEEEISFFIENFRKKAVSSGLAEDKDSLIPIKSERDQEILSYLNSSKRPPSASTRPSSRFGESQADGMTNPREILKLIPSTDAGQIDIGTNNIDHL